MRLPLRPPTLRLLPQPFLLRLLPQPLPPRPPRPPRPLPPRPPASSPPRGPTGVCALCAGVLGSSLASLRVTCWRGSLPPPLLAALALAVAGPPAPPLSGLLLSGACPPPPLEMRLPCALARLLLCVALCLPAWPLFPALVPGWVLAASLACVLSFRPSLLPPLACLLLPCARLPGRFSQLLCRGGRWLLHLVCFGQPPLPLPVLYCGVHVVVVGLCLPSLLVLFRSCPPGGWLLQCVIEGRRCIDPPTATRTSYPSAPPSAMHACVFWGWHPGARQSSFRSLRPICPACAAVSLAP